MSNPYSEAQRQDWQNRDFVEIISRNIKKIADFLNHFDQSCRGRLAQLNEKITHLERKVDFLEASISGACSHHAQVSSMQQEHDKISVQTSHRVSNSTLASQQ